MRGRGIQLVGGGSFVPARYDDFKNGIEFLRTPDERFAALSDYPIPQDDPAAGRGWFSLHRPRSHRLRPLRQVGRPSRVHLHRSCGLDKGLSGGHRCAACPLFAQDWGGLIGLRVAAEEPERFDRLAIGNTRPPVGRSIGEGFDAWLNRSQTMEVMDVGGMLQVATQARELSEAFLQDDRGEDVAAALIAWLT